MEMDELIQLVIREISRLTIDEYKNIKNLIFSPEYQNMSPSERNKRLGREIAASITIRVAVTSKDSLLNHAKNLILNSIIIADPPIYIHNSTLDSWRENGTSDDLREKIEMYFYGNQDNIESN